MSRYQYETSPRKIEPKFDPNKKEKKNNKIEVDKEKLKQDRKKTKKVYNRNIALIVAMFFVLLVISYRNSLINEKFKEIQNKKTELLSIKKTNEQLEVSIESSLNLDNIEEEARNNLNLQKLDNSQKVYVTLPKKDYIEVATDEVKIEKENQNWFKKIINKILGE